MQDVLDLLQKTKSKNKSKVDGLEAGDWVVGRAQMVPAFVCIVKVLGFYSLNLSEEKTEVILP